MSYVVRNNSSKIYRIIRPFDRKYIYLFHDTDNIFDIGHVKRLYNAEVLLRLTLYVRNPISYAYALYFDVICKLRLHIQCWSYRSKSHYALFYYVYMCEYWQCVDDFFRRRFIFVFWPCPGTWQYSISKASMKLCIQTSQQHQSINFLECFALCLVRADQIYLFHPSTRPMYNVNTYNSVIL